jgi:hypothetical protein
MLQGRAAEMTDKGIRQLWLFDCVCVISKLVPKLGRIQFAKRLFLNNY